MSYTGDRTKYGQVYVTNYHDGETNKNFTPVDSTNPLGTAYIGSEAGYILPPGGLTGVNSPYYFGKGIYEADE